MLYYLVGVVDTTADTQAGHPCPEEPAAVSSTVEELPVSRDVIFSTLVRQEHLVIFLLLEASSLVQGIGILPLVHVEYNNNNKG